VAREDTPCVFAALRPTRVRMAQPVTEQLPATRVEYPRQDSLPADPSSNDGPLVLGGVERSAAAKGLRHDRQALSGKASNVGA